MDDYHGQPDGGDYGSSDFSSVSELSRTPTVQHDDITVALYTTGDQQQAVLVAPEQTVTAVEIQSTTVVDSVEAVTTADHTQAVDLLKVSAAIADARLGPAVGGQSREELTKQLPGGKLSLVHPRHVQPDSTYRTMVAGHPKGASHGVPLDWASRQVTVPSNTTLTLSLRNSSQPVSSSVVMSSLADCSDLSSSASVVFSEATTPANVGSSPKKSAPASLPTTPNTTSTPSLVSSSPERLSPQQLGKSSLLHTSLASPVLPSLLPIHHTLPTKSHFKIKPKASIPLNLTSLEYARQCVAAAESSRLNPYALQEEEYMLLREHISHAQIITYLNIRNGILRLWLRKPDKAVTRNDAIGCAKEVRWFDAASFCFDWLVRRGYINFGCVEFKNQGAEKGPQQKDEGRGKLETGGAGAKSDLQDPTRTPKAKRRRKIVIIGAGMAGLGCARQLENLFRQYHGLFDELGQEPPEILVLEGRNRIGGRIYSRAFHARPQYAISGFDQKRCTAEMGGMIITGFDRGNPMNVLVRGQLGLGYHTLLSTTDLYDINGQQVDIVRDNMVEKLFNECLDRVSEYKFKLPVSKTVEVDHELVDEGRDSSSDGYKSIAAAEDKAAARTAAAKAAKTKLSLIPLASTKKKGASSSAASATTRGEILVKDGREPTAQTAAQKLRQMGWSLRPGIPETRDLDLGQAATKPDATLGYVVDEAIKQYRELVELNAQDLRLLNWHVANLEYGNAINQDRLSLRGWDIDAGNEWEGKHSIVVGGYQSVARGLMLCPTPLNVQRQMVVRKILYSCNASSSTATTTKSEERPPVTIECDSGHTFEADYVVNTIPLGVLKSGTVEFSPPLPESKAGAIARLGYGVLNKIILSYRKVFWDPERDIFGVLRAPTNLFSLDQKEYSRRRGRMFQWFNVSKATGMPCLVALMAGDAAYDAERLSNDELVAEATAVLRSVFGAQNVPTPTEAFVTRWASDEFSCGSYSSAGPDMEIDDYGIMARPVEKTLFFAGEHTIGTHPATVHGAFLSGLRAASEVFDELVGPIHVSTPLVAPREATVPQAVKRKAASEDNSGANRVGSAGGSEENSQNMSAGSAYRMTKVRNRQQMDTYEMHVQEYVHSKIGRRPETPPRVVDTSYLLFSRANYELARRRCEERRRPRQGRLLPNEVRVLTSKMWRSASAEERRPYAEQAMAQKQAYEVALREHSVKTAAWDQLAADLRAVYEKEHPARGRPGATNESGAHAASGSADAVPAQRSPFGGWRLRQRAGDQGGDASHMDIAAGEKAPPAA